MYPDVLVPAERDCEDLRKSVLLALDTSVSIDRGAMARMLGIARGIPRDKVEVQAVTFDTAVYSIELWRKETQSRLPGGGGTSFAAIEKYAASRHRYPDLVVVLTDGYAATPQVSHPDRWFWVLTANGRDLYVEGIGRRVKIS